MRQPARRWRGPSSCVAAATVAALAFSPPVVGQKQFADLPVKRYMPVDFDQTWSLAAGDVDGDGDIDLVTGNWDKRAAPGRLYLNDGTGRFTDASLGRLPISVVGWTVALGDVDGDGDLDLIDGGATEGLYLNDGSAHFTAAPAGRLPPTFGAINAFGIGDIDADGDLDLVLATDGSSQDLLWRNDGTGTFTDVTAAALPGPRGVSAAVALGDVDADGDLDIVFGHVQYVQSTDPQDRLYLNDGTGNFTDVTALRMPVDVANTWAVALADVDGDHDLDLVLGRSLQNGLYLNDGTGAFADATTTWMPMDGDETHGVALADVDGDGDPDLVMGNSVVPHKCCGQQTRVYRNDGVAFADVTAIWAPVDSDDTRAVLAADVDGDGDPDFVLANADAVDGRQNRLYLDDGSGKLVDASRPRLTSGAVYSWAIATTDVDGDGDVDLVMGNGGQSQLYVNDGAGTFTDVTASQMPKNPYPTTAGVAFGDVDGDGDPDLVLANDRAQSNLYFNDGHGTFTDGTTSHLPLRKSSAGGVAFGDVDGDGDVDLLIGSARLFLYLNDGRGTFTDVTSRIPPVPAASSSSVAFGDVDGDGDLDVVFGLHDYNPHQTGLLLNDGTGMFTDVTATQIPNVFVETRSLALGDVDGDGDLDIVTGNEPGSGVDPRARLYLNDGTGFFVDVTQAKMPPDSDATTGLALGDVDEDGDLDLLLGMHDQYGAQNRLYLNDGSGRFVDYTPLRFPTRLDMTLAVALVDVDGDADLDAIIANNGTNRVLTNLHRQLFTLDFPAVSRRFHIEVQAEPGYATAPHAALPLVNVLLAPAPIPVPPLGVLYLDPSYLPLPSITVPQGSGVGVAEVAIPAVSAWVGLPLYVQAALIGTGSTPGQPSLTGFTADTILR